MRAQSFFVLVTLIAAGLDSGIGGFFGPPQVLAQERTDAPDAIVVSGVVVKPDGSPAEGAVIRSAVPVTAALETRLAQKIISKIHETTVGVDGRFEISISKSPLNHIMTSEPRWNQLWESTPIVALLAGFGPAHIEIGDADVSAPITLKLVEDLPVRGQIIDLEGQPVRGTRVTIDEVQMLKGDDPSRMLSALEKVGAGEQVFILAPHFQKQWGLELVDRRLIDLPENVVTDQNGEFEIRGLGKDRVIHFALNGGDVAWRTITAISRETDPIQPSDSAPAERAPGGARFQARVPEPLYGSKFQVAVPPSRPVEGTVVDAETGKPLAGVSVEMERPRSHRLGRATAMHTNRPLTVVKTTTDESGHFRLMGMAKTDGNSLLVFPHDDQPYFHEEINVRDEPGIDPINLTVKLHRGIWIKGRITDKETHDPVVGAKVHYYPLRKNELAAKVPVFGRGGVVEPDLDRFKTAADGSYRLVGLPGSGVVTASSAFRPYRTGVGLDRLTTANNEPGQSPFTYRMPIQRLVRDLNVVREINPGADEQEVRVDLQFEPGISISVRFIDSVGVPVKDVSAWGPGVRQIASSPANFRNEIVNDGTIVIENLGPDDKPEIHVYHFERNLGRKFHLEPPYEKGREIIIALEPMAIVTGRLFEEGAPMQRVSIGRSYHESDRGPTISLSMPPGISTNAEGRFRCPLIPGHEYQLRAQGRSFGPGPGSIVAEKLNLKAGETVDVGDLEFEDGRFRRMKAKEQTEKSETKNEPK